MRRYLLTCLLGFTVCAVLAQATCPIIPQPSSAKIGTGHFVLTKNTAIVVDDPSLRTTAHFLQKEMLRLQDIPLSTQNDQSDRQIIRIRIDPTIRGEEA